VLATTALWISLGVLAALLIGLIAGAFMLLAMGRLNLDLGWGRSIHPLGPITVEIDAPRELVFEILAAPYLERASGPGIEVLARDGHLAVAAHHTKVHFYTARTVEVIELNPPAGIGFRHLTGPVPHALEEFSLTDDGDRSELLYSGEIGIDFFVPGRLAGRLWVRPQWERAVRSHLEDVKERAERRSARR
jgi:hypothetical protein